MKTAKTKRTPAEALMETAGKTTTIALQSGIPALGKDVEVVRVKSAAVESASENVKHKQLVLRSFSASQDDRDGQFDTVADAVATIAKLIVPNAPSDALSRSVYESRDRVAFTDSLAQALRSSGVPMAMSLADVVTGACEQWSSQTTAHHTAVSELDAAKVAEKAACYQLEVAVKHLELAMLESAPAALQALRKKPKPKRKREKTDAKPETPATVPPAAVPA